MSEPPFYYLVLKASRVLNCSFMELYAHEERNDLVSFALAVEEAENLGEIDMKTNSEYKAKVKSLQKKMEIK